MDLGPYFIPAGRIAGCATVLVPAAVIFSLYSARKSQLEAAVQMGGRLRIALLAHAAYFSVLPFLFEGGLDVAGVILDKFGISPGSVPPAPDNLFWQMSNLCGELFFVATVAYLAMANLNSVPRWTLLVPLSQVAYNLKNSLLWLVLYKYFSPTGTANIFMLADVLIIFPLALIYVAAYLDETGLKKGMFSSCRRAKNTTMPLRYHRVVPATRAMPRT